MAITASDVHIDVALSNISIGYQNEEYIADQIFGHVPSDKQSNKYYTWDKEMWFRNNVQIRAPGSEYPEGDLKLSNTPFFCDIYHLGYPINDEDVSNADAAIDLENTGADWLADQFMLNREVQFVTDFFKTTVWDTDVTGTTDFVKWSDSAGSDPIADLILGGQTIQKNTGKRPNTLVVGQEVFDSLAEHPDLLEKYKYTNVAILSKSQVADAFRMPKLLIGSAIDNSAVEGAATPFVGEYLWPDRALLAYISPTIGLRIATAGLTFTWEIDGSGLTIPIQRVREDRRGRTVLQARHAFDQKAVGTDLGYFFDDVL